MLREGRLVLEGALTELKTSLASEISVQADDLPRAGAMVAARGFACEHIGTELIIRLGVADDPRQAAAVLARTLCDGGIALHAITPREASLERLYQAASAVHCGESLHEGL